MVCGLKVKISYMRNIASKEKIQLKPLYRKIKEENRMTKYLLIDVLALVSLRTMDITHESQ